VARIDPYRDRSPSIVRLGWVLVALLVALVAFSFVVDVGTAAPDPVAYDRTAALGVSAETDATMAGEREIPKAQVFYSQFQYVVGYAGIETMVSDFEDPSTDRQLGYPIAAYVQTYDGASPTIDGNGHLTATGSKAWTPPNEAVYVVDSGARSPAGETVVPFEHREAAESFTAEYGGSILTWAAVRDRSFEVDTAATVRREVPDRWRRADERIARASQRTDRPTSVVVGREADSIQDAIDRAEPNTTVVVPEGTYEERIRIEKPITLAGRDAALRGNGTGSVITVRSENVSITGFRISGTGNRTRNDEAIRQPPGSEDDDDGAWDEHIQTGYGYGDAGIVADDSSGLVVADTAIETDASGVLLRNGSDAVIRDVRVNGTAGWENGFMGVTALNSRVTVTGSAFTGGRDGIYLHRADGSVIRNSTFRDDRYGVHLMYTSDALIADNAFRDQEFGGITVMTRPEGNAIVGNDVRRTPTAIQPSGIRSYVGYNTLVDNELGLSTSARESVYEYNVIADNEMGARSTTVIPSSLIARNDFVGNDRHASAGSGPLRIWADGDHGNYWEGAYESPARWGSNPGETATGTRSATLDRAYRPSSPVDAALHREPAATTLAESPAVRALSELRGSVAGSRSGSVIDPAPARTPHSPGRIERVNDSDGSNDTDGSTGTDWSNDSTDPIHAEWREELTNASTTDRETMDDGNGMVTIDDGKRREDRYMTKNGTATDT
jgi:nitrous oxidase accessory protein NosD/nitrous oxide reductase accessory protein NosL